MRYLLFCICLTAAAQCARTVINPITGKQDCVSTPAGSTVLGSDMTLPGSLAVGTTLPGGAPANSIALAGNVYAANKSNVILAVEGDSITEAPGCGGCTGRLNWPYQMGNLSPIWSTGTLHNFAIGADTVAAMVGEYATQAHTVRPTNLNDTGYFFLRGGINDIGTGATGAAIYANLKAIWAAARFDGYKVVAFTISGTSSLAGATLTEFNNLNSLIVGDPTQYDYLVRDDLVLPSPGSTLLFNADGAHPNPFGSARTSRAVADALQQTIPVTQNIERVWNNGFEQSKDGWDCSASAAITTVAAEVHGGAQALNLPTGTGCNFLQPGEGTVIAGTTYNVSFWTRGDGTHQGQYYIYDNTHSSYIQPLTATGITSTTYSYFSTSFTAPAGTTEIYLSLRGPASAGNAYFDDVSMRAILSGVPTGNLTIATYTFTKVATGGSCTEGTAGYGCIRVTGISADLPATDTATMDVPFLVTPAKAWEVGNIAITTGVGDCATGITTATVTDLGVTGSVSYFKTGLTHNLKVNSTFSNMTPDLQGNNTAAANSWTLRVTVATEHVKALPVGCTWSISVPWVVRP